MKSKRKLIYDVGIHKGEDTAFYLKKGFKVIAFEANPDLINTCKKKFAKEIESGALTIVPGAIVDKTAIAEDTTKFYKNDDLSVWSTVNPDWSAKYAQMGADSTVIEVQTIDFEHCLEEFGVPHYLKIDIEGMDMVCLQSLVHFEEKPAYISLESEKMDFEKLVEEFELLERLGYNKFQIVNQANISSMKEPEDTQEGEFLGTTFEMGSSGLFGSDIRKPWLTVKSALNAYKRIFLEYRLWGDESQIKDYWFMEGFRKAFSIVSGRPMHAIPGWFDTHARHSSVDPS